MKKILYVILLLAVSVLSIQAKKQATSYRPRLVVGIVVDQMRWDYLERYRTLYGQDGLMRMMREGYSCDQCMIPYLPTVTAVGHASVFTGAYPALTGIVSNNFKINNQIVYAVDDPSVNPVGTESGAGKRSPRNLLPTTITDELRMATNFRGKVIGVSIKDRASILPAGHTANAAYWVESGTNPRFITSDYYMKELPQWVKDFNNEKRAEKYMQKGWQWMYLDSVYDEQSHSFDKRIECNCGDDIRDTPGGTTLTLDFASAAIRGEQLGNDDVTDFLTINIASTDLIAHRTGCNSRYVEDTYLQFDHDLGDFLKFLDKEVGQGQYTIFLTADHAGSHNPVYRKDHKLPAEIFETSQVKHQLDSVIWANLPTKDTLILSLGTYQVIYDREKLQKSGIEEAKMTEVLLDYLRKRSDVAYAFDFQHIPDYVPEPLRSMAIRGYNPKRSGEIQIIPESGVTEAYDHWKGASHALWGPDDAHIPLLWFGWGIPHGRSSVPCENIDIASTVANLLHIQMPSANVGRPIQMQ